MWNSVTPGERVWPLGEQMQLFFFLAKQQMQLLVKGYNYYEGCDVSWKSGCVYKYDTTQFCQTIILIGIVENNTHINFSLFLSHQFY